MKKFTFLLFLGFSSSHLLCAGENPERTWTDIKGRPLAGTYLRDDGESVWIRGKSGGEVMLTLAKLSPADQAAVKALQSDLTWKLASARWPALIQAPATRQAFEDSKLAKGKFHVFRTRAFEFKVDQALKPQQVAEFGRTFEASIELFRNLPWDIRPVLPKETYYLARLYENRLDFTSALQIQDQGNSRVLGLYRHNDRTIHVPLESLLGGKSDSNETLRHELAHQMMHDMLPLMPWWVAEGTAEYVRSIPWDGRGGYNCAAVFTPAVMKKLAGEGSMNEQAFGEMLRADLTPPSEAQLGQQFASAHGAAQQELIRIRQERAAPRAGRAAEVARQRQAVEKMSGGVEYGTSVVPAMRSPFSDEGQATVLKYHAAKLLVYYLQHLEGDGKGARMLQLLWHLRHWADEMNVQRARFAKEEERFRAGFKKYEERVREFDKMETAYHEAYLNWLRTNTGKPTDPPKPVAPEEELLKLLPPVPDYAAFTPLRLQARWTEIRNKTIGDKPESYYQAILDAFKKRKIDLPVQEGDPRSVSPKPFKVIIK